MAVSGNQNSHNEPSDTVVFLMSRAIFATAHKPPFVGKVLGWTESSVFHAIRQEHWECRHRLLMSHAELNFCSRCILNVPDDPSKKGK